MSDMGSELGSDEPRRRSLPTDEFLYTGNPNLMGIPFFRHLRELEGDQEDRASLLDSAQFVSTYDSSDETGSGVELVQRPTTRYGTWKSIEEGITLTWRDLNVYVPQRRPCGAGKSTLMNALAHRTPGEVVIDGDILVNGHRANSSMNALSGYVHQDDIFIGSLTVKEHLTFMARLRMDVRTSASERRMRIQELVKELGLTKVQDSRIGTPGLDKSLSGGERKRLAFATEILTDPPLLFCDEPTTGLDSFNAKKLVKMMREMAARGKTIVCTIHQPSTEVFLMFDKLLLLAEGRLAYIGSSSGALEFLDGLGHKCPSTFNPADYYIHTLAVHPGHELRSRERIKKICDNFAVSPYAKDKATTYSGVYPASSTTTSTIMALLIGVCYTNVTLNQAGVQDIEGVLFIFITENTFPSVYAVLNIFPQELPLFLREYKNGIYRCDIYYISKMLSMAPGFIMDPVIFVTICYWIVGLQHQAYQFFMTVLILIFTTNTASACGWVKYLSWFMYSNEALTITQWKGVQEIECDTAPGVPCLTTGDEVINKFSFSNWHLPFDLSLMALLYLGFHIIGFCGLYSRARRK
ncbi:scarlet-like 2 [Homarus americanus]|uniref:Scarlet-like 2 n=1 Tax=Homarus americanus TaxID=6706 RepID=A0A8J5MXA9_HOMAM|nr:scarlet-like 2 [Homarus americanus]